MSAEDDPFKNLAGGQPPDVESVDRKKDTSRLMMLLLGARVAAEIIFVEPVVNRVNKLTKKKPARSRSAWLDN